MQADDTSPQDSPGHFALKDCALIAIATGKRAHSLKELRDHLVTINEDSIYYHFWGGLIQPRFEEREFNNDFASWARHGLHDGTLAEKLAVVDPTEFTDPNTLRNELVELVEERLEEREFLRWMPAGRSFEFIRSQIVVFDTHSRVSNPRELCALLPHVSSTSIFYHFIDARQRFPEGVDDFRFWLSGFGHEFDDLAVRLAQVDPYFAPMTELRSNLINVFREYFKESAS
ncbi:DUF5752 family protein [Thiohalomonas denitrificans]|nr:DUF5752 family protein [Thiohalomonas denitrificans]